MLRSSGLAGQRLRPILLGVGLGLLVVIVATGWLLWRARAIESAAKPDSIASDTPLALVNGVAITPNMVEREIRVSRFNIIDPPPPLSGADLERAGQEALNQLISRQLVLQAAAQQGFVLDDHFIEQQVALLFGGYGPEKLNQVLTQAGLTRADLFWWVAELTTVEEFSLQVVMAGAAPENRQRVYNDWLNRRQAEAIIQTFQNGRQQSPAALPGHAAPDFALTTLTGQTAALSDYRGQVVLINFWATWCPSCIAEMPHYDAIYRQQPLADFIVLGVNLQENRPQVRQFVDGLGLSFPILLDEDGQVTIDEYQIPGMPGSIIVDRQGIIFYRHIGPMSGQLLAEKLAELD